jgi:hypothetical protein
MVSSISNDAFYRLGDVAEVRLGYPFRGAVSGLVGGGARVIQMKDLSRNGLAPMAGWLETALPGRGGGHELVDGDVLFGARGTSYCACLVSDPPSCTVASQHMYVIRTRRRERLLPEFLAWQLNQPPAQRYFAQSAEGSRQLSIRRAVLEAVPLRVPPPSQQQAVVALQRTADAERRVLQTLIDHRAAELAAIAERLLA